MTSFCGVSREVERRLSAGDTGRTAWTRLRRCCKASVCVPMQSGSDASFAPMRAIRELPLVAPLAARRASPCSSVAAPANGSVPWLGAGALRRDLWRCSRSAACPGGVASVAAARRCSLCGARSRSAWSWLPDRSWDYANRTLLYALAATLGLWFAGRARAARARARGAARRGRRAGRSSARCFPPVYDYGSIGVTARLTGPVGLWNQLALAGDFALSLALWLRAAGAGTLLAFACARRAPAHLLARRHRSRRSSSSPSGSLLADDRLERRRRRSRRPCPRRVVVGDRVRCCPASPRTTSRSHVRWRDGMVFGAAARWRRAGALALDAAAAAARTRAAATLGDRRSWSPPSRSRSSSLVVRGVGSGTVVEHRAGGSPRRARTSASRGGSRRGTGSSTTRSSAPAPARSSSSTCSTGRRTST